MYQIEKDQAKKKSTEKNRIMKRGGETLEEIKTALNQKTVNYKVFSSIFLYFT